MPYQWLYGYPSLVVDGLPQSGLIKAHNQASFWKCFCIALPDKLGLFPRSFCYVHTVSCHRILGQLPYTIQPVRRILKNWENKKEKGEEGEVKETYIWLSCTLAVVKSAVKGTIRSPAAAAVVDVRCSLYPKTHPPCVTVSPPCIRVNART